MAASMSPQLTSDIQVIGALSKLRESSKIDGRWSLVVDVGGRGRWMGKDGGVTKGGEKGKRRQVNKFRETDRF